MRRSGSSSVKADDANNSAAHRHTASAVQLSTALTLPPKNKAGTQTGSASAMRDPVSINDPTNCGEVDFTDDVRELFRDDDMMTSMELRTTIRRAVN